MTQLAKLKKEKLLDRVKMALDLAELPLHCVETEDEKGNKGICVEVFTEVEEDALVALDSPDFSGYIDEEKICTKRIKRIKSIMKKAGLKAAFDCEVARAGLKAVFDLEVAPDVWVTE